MLLAAGAAALAFAHPMGNFSVNHYARIEAAPGGLRIRYVLDLAEIPTFELFQQWGEGADPKKKVFEQAQTWAKGLDLRVDGAPVKAQVRRAEIVLGEGAGNMQVARVVSGSGGRFARRQPDVRGPQLSGPLGVEGDCAAGRQGPQCGTYRLSSGSVGGSAAGFARDVSLASGAGLPQRTGTGAASVVAPPPAAPPVPGTVVKGDYLSQLLHRGEIGWGLTLIGMAVAFGLGAMHAMSPGHGKTIVAAYLVGSRGTFKHAAFLGAMVTFTHTASVFLLGFVTLFLSKYILPEKLVPILGAISGISIVWVGATLFVRRVYGTKAHHHHHHHRS